MMKEHRLIGHSRLKNRIDIIAQLELDFLALFQQGVCPLMAIISQRR